jgi:hypothetical protein
VEILEMDEIIFDFTQVSLFTNRVFERSRKLIETGIWQGIDKHRLEGWIEGLAVHDQSDLLAACLLDNLIYRSRDQVHALIRNLFYSHMGITEQKLQEDLISLLKRKNDGSVVITPVIALHQPPTKSGPYILRIAQRLFRFHDANLKWPFDLESHAQKIKFLLCIDDFCGTGSTFEKFITKNRIDEIHSQYPDVRIIYFVAAAHSEGIGYINKKFPYIEIYCSDRLSEQHHFFNGSIFEKYGTPGLQKYVTQRYEDFTTKNSVALPGSKFYQGFGQLGLTYAAFHSTPNNSLPVFWSGNGLWKPLLDR